MHDASKRNVECVLKSSRRASNAPTLTKRSRLLAAANPPLGFWSAAIDTLVACQHPASDHFAPQRSAIAMMQFENRVHLRLAVASAGFEESDQPLQDYQSLLVADRNFDQAVSIHKVVENFSIRAARFGRHRQTGDTVAAENRAANLSEHLFIQAVPAEVAVSPQSYE